MDSKTCKECGVDKILDEYGRNGKWYLSRCKPCTSIARAIYYKNNRKEFLERQKEYDIKNKDKKSAYRKIYNKGNVKTAEYHKWYVKTFPEKRKKKRVAAKKKSRLRIPSWHKKERKEILELYAFAKECRASGIDVQVDHIIPLCGELVSGLHTFDNLQIITSYENQSKNNSYAV